MRYNGVIQRKLAILDKQLNEIRLHLKNVTYKEFEDSWGMRSMTERALQVAVEILIDISERIIALENAGPASTASECIEKLVALNVLESKEPFVDMFKFRNVIVHQYEEVDPAILFNLAKNKLGDFRKFMNAIDNVS
jgi:uncharacterized protein YutE (UPF0331/DUF86 family)